MFTRKTIPTVLLSCLLPFACGGGPSAAEAAKQANATKKDAKMDEALAKRKAEREAKEQAKKDAEEKEKAAIDAICVLPEKMPKDLDKACEEVAQANDRFMTRLYEGPALEKWKTAKGTQMPMTKVQCTQADSIEVAACQINAMDSAGPELKKTLPQLLRTCIDKFAKGGPPPGGGIPKPKPG